MAVSFVGAFGRVFLVGGLSLCACGGIANGPDDAGDASSDACKPGSKCAQGFDAAWFSDSPASDGPTSSCPPTPPLPPAMQDCFGGPSECDYTIQTDAGSSIGVTCKCVPSGEDMMAYQCAEPYSLCMSSSGQLFTSFKTCQSDTDCQIQREQTDCAGSTLFVGVNKASFNQLQTCEVDWAAQFQPPCSGTAIGKAEDGNQVALIGPTISAHCTATSNGNQCMTTSP